MDDDREASVDSSEGNETEDALYEGSLYDDNSEKANTAVASLLDEEPETSTSEAQVKGEENEGEKTDENEKTSNPTSRRMQNPTPSSPSAPSGKREVAISPKRVDTSWIEESIDTLDGKLSAKIRPVSNKLDSANWKKQQLSNPLSVDNTKLRVEGSPKKVDTSWMEKSNSAIDEKLSASCTENRPIPKKLDSINWNKQLHLSPASYQVELSPKKLGTSWLEKGGALDEKLVARDARPVIKKLDSMNWPKHLNTPTSSKAKPQIEVSPSKVDTSWLEKGVCPDEEAADRAVRSVPKKLYIANWNKEPLNSPVSPNKIKLQEEIARLREHIQKLEASGSTSLPIARYVKPSELVHLACAQDDKHVPDARIDDGSNGSSIDSGVGMTMQRNGVGPGGNLEVIGGDEIRGARTTPATTAIESYGGESVTLKLDTISAAVEKIGSKGEQTCHEDTLDSEASSSHAVENDGAASNEEDSVDNAYRNMTGVCFSADSHVSHDLQYSISSSTDLIGVALAGSNAEALSKESVISLRSSLVDLELDDLNRDMGNFLELSTLDKKDTDLKGGGSAGLRPAVEATMSNVVETNGKDSPLTMKIKNEYGSGSGTEGALEGNLYLIGEAENRKASSTENTHPLEDGHASDDTHLASATDLPAEVGDADSEHAIIVEGTNDQNHDCGSTKTVCQPIVPPQSGQVDTPLATSTRAEEKSEFFCLINQDPWNKESSVDDDRLGQIVDHHPQYCRKKYKFEGFNGSIYPLSALCALGASVTTIKKCYNAYADAITEADAWVGTSLHYACSYQAPLEVVEYLAKKNPFALKAVNQFKRLPLHMYVARTFCHHTERRRAHNIFSVSNQGVHVRRGSRRSLLPYSKVQWSRQEDRLCWYAASSCCMRHRWRDFLP